MWQSGGAAEKPQWAVREGDWKLLQNPLGNKYFVDGNNSENLYLFNVREDVSEKNNQAEAHPEIVKRLQKKYEEWLEEVLVQ